MPSKLPLMTASRPRGSRLRFTWNAADVASDEMSKLLMASRNVFVELEQNSEAILRLRKTLR
jgi:hypothetical protein